ncbi:MAG: hypothetical protein E6K78_05515 [Candidatus Eisenbacteria bacterium]|uniref:Uncharacterized protein n=1 Tax=Eiseniibacteriota bacterium TaxID=2212470 RepID=A0A538TUA1_UNCEI|nr:MAG: hypothetical protein E6K78_05515 [Candidatus Eisenbacteria bacterium]
MHDEDLTPEERAAFQSLPRERRPGPWLEERTVRALRRLGLLRAARPDHFLSPAWATAIAAVVLAVFAGGFAVGQWLEARQTREVLAAMHEQDAARAAALIQQSGSAYVAALSRLADLADSSRARDVQQGREVATNILHAAANQLVRLEPEEPVATHIIQGLERAAQRDTNTVAAADHRLIWF